MWMLKARPTPMLSIVWSPWAVQLQSWMEREVLGWLWSSVGGQQGCGGKAAWDACEGVNKLWEHKAAIWHLECQIQHCFSNLCLSDLFGLGGEWDQEWLHTQIHPFTCDVHLSVCGYRSVCLWITWLDLTLPPLSQLCSLTRELSLCSSGCKSETLMW